MGNYTSMVHGQCGLCDGIIKEIDMIGSTNGINIAPTVNTSPSYTAGTGVTVNAMTVFTVGKLLIVDVNLSVTSAIAHNGEVFTLSGYGTSITNASPNSLLGSSSGAIARIRPSISGNNISFIANGGVIVGTYYIGTALVVLA